MNVLKNLFLLQMGNTIKSGVTLRNNPVAYSEYKKDIRNKLGIFFYNVIKTQDPCVVTIMIKREGGTYIYSYNAQLDELILKGERKNVSI